MSKDCKDALQTLKTVTKRECDAKWEHCQMRSSAELSRLIKLRVNSSVFNWRLKDDSEGNDVRELDRLFNVRTAATGKARSPAVERRVGGTTSVDVDEERRRWRAARSDSRSSSRDKYDGARPFRPRKTSTESLNSIRCSILSQCSSWRSGVTWPYLFRDKTSRAAVGSGWRHAVDQLSASDLLLNV